MAATDRTDAADRGREADRPEDAGVGMAHPTVVPTNADADDAR